MSKKKTVSKEEKAHKAIREAATKIQKQVTALKKLGLSQKTISSITRDLNPVEKIAPLSATSTIPAAPAKSK